jgi:hypothetical protein
MRTLRLAASAALLIGSAAAPVGAQPNAPVIGRWDLTVTGKDGAYPSWLEVTLSGHRTLVGRFVGGGGSARPISRVTWDNGTVRFAIPPQWELATADLRAEATLAGDTLRGTLTTPMGTSEPFVGVRAPLLRRTAPPDWGTPVVLFDGKGMDAWRPMGRTSHWAVVNGVLTNRQSGANLVTTGTFTDFQLHLEVRYPPKGNSGIYLRGRHEVQVEDSPAEPLSIHMGGIYGFLTPNENASRGPGQWDVYDITLVGRRVTVVLNGKTIIGDQTIPGITGGALDSREGEPGPIYLQGDHTAVEYRNIVIRPAKP